jgi:hypothetical protein
MNGMFSNSGGLNDLAKHVHIVDCCQDYNLDFFLFQKRVNEITHQGLSTASPVV